MVVVVVVVVVVVEADVVVVVVLEPDVVVVVVVEAEVVVVVLALMLIAPSTSFTLEVMSRPFVSEMNASDHFTGYLPSAQSSGTVYVSTRTLSPSLAVIPLPIVCAKAYSFVAAFSTSVAL